MLSDAQPASATLYTPRDDMARKNSSPMFRSTTSMPGAKGMTVKDMSTTTMITAGAMMNTGLVGKGRDPVLFGEDLDHVRQHLQQAEGPHAVRAVPVLPERQQPALEPDQHAADGQHHEEDAEEDDKIVGWCRSCVYLVLVSILFGFRAAIDGE